jgi:hypothetical protein
LDNFEEVVTPEQFRGVLANHGARISNLEKWVEKQNGSIQRLGDEVKGLREDMHNNFDELKDCIYESKEKTEHKQSLNWKQVITIAITLLVGLPGSLWGLVQLVSFLSKG